MAEQFDLEEMRRLTEECHEVTIMWFDKEGKSLGDPNGMPGVMPALIQELRVRRVAFRNMKVDEAMRFISENQEQDGGVSPEALANALKMTVNDAAALMVVLEYADMIKTRLPGERN